jgi:hypothetical protein
LIVTSMVLALNVIGYLACGSQHRHYTRLQAQIEALPPPAADDEEIPTSNRPRGQLSGITGWAAFYGDLERALAKVLWVSGLFVIFGFVWARAPRTG